MFCPKCGKETDALGKFCQWCGSDIVATPVTPNAAPEEEEEGPDVGVYARPWQEIYRLGCRYNPHSPYRDNSNHLFFP